MFEKVLIVGIGNVVCTQLRCISLLTVPMYCGKPGRGVLKAVVLTYVIAGKKQPYSVSHSSFKGH